MVGYVSLEVDSFKHTELSKRPRTRPAWLDVLLAEKFFTVCVKHNSLKKNEKNIFCLNCVSGICQHCAVNHSSHRLLQIRRYVYHDVIRVHDIQKLVDCSRVQTYVINGARVVFLNERPQPKSTKGLSNTCESCDRSLQEAYNFCSVACKVQVAFRQGKELVRAACRGVDHRFKPSFNNNVRTALASRNSLANIGNDTGTGDFAVKEDFMVKKAMEQLNLESLYASSSDSGAEEGAGEEGESTSTVSSDEAENEDDGGGGRSVQSAGIGRVMGREREGIAELSRINLMKKGISSKYWGCSAPRSDGTAKSSSGSRRHLSSSHHKFTVLAHSPRSVMIKSFASASATVSSNRRKRLKPHRSPLS